MKLTYQYSNSLIEFSKKAAILEKDHEFQLINDWRDNKNPVKRARGSSSFAEHT